MDIKIAATPDAQVPIDELMNMFHPENSQVRDDEEMTAIKESIRVHGLTGECIIVNRWNMKIVSGHGRTQACWDLGYRGKMPVIYVDLSSEIAHRNVMLQRNRARGHQDPDKEAREVLALVEEYGQRQVATEMAFTPEEIAAIVDAATKGPVTKAGGGDGYGGGSGGNNDDEVITCPHCGHKFVA